MTKIAFFDVDGTLIRPYSSFLFGLYCFENNLLPYSALLKAYWHRFLHKINWYNYDTVLRKWAAWTERYSFETVSKHLQGAFEEKIRYAFVPSIVKKIIEHADAGYKVILITATNHHFSTLIAKYLPISDHASLEITTYRDLLTHDNIKSPHPYHEGKIFWADKFIEKYDSDLKDAYFYSDSSSDLPLLNHVGYPIAVNPDWQLKRIAIKNNWPIIVDYAKMDIGLLEHKI